MDFVNQQAGDGDDLVKEIREHSGAVIVVAAGEITLADAPAFHKRLVDICSRGPRQLIVELSAVSHIDSAGVGTLVEIYRRVTRSNGRMSLVGMNTRVRSVFEITKLDQFFSIFDTEQEALES